MKQIAWFSCGATSAVACKKAIESNSNIEIYYIDTGSHHKDNDRFLKECQDWYGKEIKILKSAYSSVLDVIQRDRFINSPRGARCTLVLKTRVRQQLEYENGVSEYYWGFEYTKKEINRAERLCDRYPDFKHHFPLIDLKLTKENCLCILEKQGIDIPKMYKLGYNNNNCIGCVKGGMGYWNKIRKDFPDIFNQMANIEREIGRSCIKNVFLDELEPNRGNIKELVPDCDVLCNQLDLDYETPQLLESSEV